MVTIYLSHRDNISIIQLNSLNFYKIKIYSLINYTNNPPLIINEYFLYLIIKIMLVRTYVASLITILEPKPRNTLEGLASKDEK